MKLEQKTTALCHAVFTSGFNSFIRRKKRRTPRGRQQNRGEDRTSGGEWSEMNGGKRERETETENGRKSEEARRQENESASEKGKNGGERERGRNVSSSSLPPRIQSHRVYSSVHLILFIGFKAFAGTPYLRIWSILWAKDLDDTCGPSPPPSVYWPSMKLYRDREMAVIKRNPCFLTYPARFNPTNSARLEIAKRLVHFQHF